MKRTILSIFAVLALIAVPALAQEQITGTVISNDGDILVLSTDQGEMSFAISDIDVPATVAVNDEVTVTYLPGDSGELVASTVIMSTDTGVEANLTAEADIDQDNDADLTATADLDDDYDQTADLDSDLAGDEDRLPATASATPLAGLIGLLALGAALGLAVLIRRGA
jgi:hypothetical protein